MAIDYVSLAATATRLIDENGRGMTLVKLDEAPPDPDEPWVPGTSHVLVDTVAVVVPFDAEDMDGTIIRRGDAQAYIAAIAGQEIETFDELHDGLRAVGTLTLAANAANNNTVTIGTRVYTFKSPFVDAANNVAVGGSASATLDNLIAAINGGAGAGTLYGTGTVAHASVSAIAGAGDTMDVTAGAIGTSGNSIATTDALAGASAWAAATLTGGVSFDGRVWRIKKCDVIAPAAVRVAYALHLQR